MVTERGREVARLMPSGPAHSPIARLVAERGATMPRGDLAYLDTSAYVKAVLRESQEDALRAEMSAWDGYVSSALLGVEAVRACSRHRNGYVEDAREWLRDVALLPLDRALLDAATSLEPPRLRSLDAIHLATALSVRDEIGAFLTYDERLTETAERHGLPIAAPA